MLFVITLVAWATDVVWLGLSARGWLLLGLRALSALTVLPLLLATLRPEPPPWLERAKLLLLGAFPVLYQLIFTLKPTSMVLQGGVMVLIWLVLSLVITVPLRLKHLVGLATLAVYGADLMYLWAQHGAAYGKPNEHIAIWLISVFAVLGLSWWPLSSEERSWREFSMREALRREVELRERHESELEASRDRAERAAVEAQQAASRAEFENRMRSAFVANISHDLRTPMAGILGLIELLRETPLNEEQVHYVETIRSSNQTLLALLNDILDFSRIEDGKLPLALSTTALDRALSAPVELLRSLADRKGVELRVELDEGLPSHVLLDTARVQQILLNLLGNAIKFTTKGAVTLRAGMTQRDNASWLRVEVKDTGIGFSDEQKERLFQRFSQVDLSVARHFGGSGLGLAICKGLVELMGGSIDAEGSPGEGARFWFEIPVEIAAAPAPTPPAMAPPRLRVLLAEDNPINQLVLATMLKKLGQDAMCVGNGQQALASLQSERFDVVLMDIQMPIMDGIEATSQLRASGGPNQQTVVVALTAGATPEERVACQQAGIDALYSKPIEMDRLRQLLCDEGARASARRAAHSHE